MYPETADIMLRFAGPVSGRLILNIGSSTEAFYRRRQPQIWDRLMRPLIEAGNEIVNLDLKSGPGVHIVADCREMPVGDESFDAVLFGSTIEHVEQPERALAEIRRVLKPDGFAVMSAPGKYPYHADPIDTGLRLGDRAAWEVVLGDTWTIEDYARTAHDCYASVIRARPCR